MNRVFILAASLALTGLCASATSITLGTFAVNPQASFLYEAPQDVGCASGTLSDCPSDIPGGDAGTGGSGPVSALFLNLASLGATAGETLQIIGVGAECFQGVTNCPPESSPELGGVFDSNNTELASSSLTPCSPQPSCPTGVDPLTGTLAVVGLPAQPLVTNNPYLNTYYGNVNTTIPNDFYIPTGTGITVVVPNGATYLVVGVLDSYYADDSDPSGTLAVQINEITSSHQSSVPEPATLGLFGMGITALVAFRRYRSR
jgi:hypothetical protein